MVISAQVLPALSRCPAVLELGSYDRNGSPRGLFPGAAYVGVDCVPGPGVDVVGDAGALEVEPVFDVVVTTETLEHTPEPGAVLATAYRALVPGGYVVVTAAAEPRLPHRCDGSEGNLRGEHYRNIDPTELWVLLRDCGFTGVSVEHDDRHGDVYALGVKPRG